MGHMPDQNKKHRHPKSNRPLPNLRTPSTHIYLATVLVEADRLDGPLVDAVLGLAQVDLELGLAQLGAPQLDDAVAAARGQAMPVGVIAEGFVGVQCSHAALVHLVEGLAHLKIP